MIPVIALPPGDQWDQNMLDLLLSNMLYPTGMEFRWRPEWAQTLTYGDETVVLIIPGRYWHTRTVEVTALCAHYRRVLAIRTGDEEDLLDISLVSHPDITWWIQTPTVGRDYGDGVRFIPLGYPPHFNALDATVPHKVGEVFLAGQDTHARRHEAFGALAGMDGVLPTAGFTQGLPTEEYTAAMTAARVAPAPAGAVSPDTFRLYEALQAHCVPIADDLSPAYDSRGYWAQMLPEAPIPVLTAYDSLPDYVATALVDYPRNANRIAAWWMAYKREMAAWLRADLGVADERTITVLVTVSPIKSHPDTVILDETIASVRAQLPDAEIIIVFDGVRVEQADMRRRYEEHIRRVLWKADHDWHNVLPLIYDGHLHQAVATKRAIEHVRTPLLLFVEADTPLTDGEIPWDAMADTIMCGDANLVRLSHEASVLEPHRYLMLDSEPQKVRGVPMTRTIQWSQRPHLASLAFYRGLLDRFFPNDERNFIEDVLYSKLCVAHGVDGDMGWLGWRTWLFTPEGNMTRSYHTDGRAGASKFDRV